ncbi:transcriptional regulator domain-containing protein [Sphingopyxis macrogoltabida]|uniref:transcriptional regulator domain-containing protein n=1 Tax=Sphingopyxis macrogoltabida TaxID=33050 RepID=UPI000B292BA6
MNGLGGDPGPAPQVPDWLLASEYAVLLFADRRSFAWEWLRRSAPYRAAWRDREGSRPSRWCNFGCGRGPSSGGFGGDV